jgi:AcrR family transcriptional regulator
MSRQLEGLSRISAERRDSSLSNIRKAADEMFRQPGYFAVSIDQLARHAGVTRKTFYKHFSGKSEVGLDWAKRRSSGAFAQWVRLKDGDADDPAWVKAWIEGLLDYYQGNSEIHSLSFLSLEEPAFGDWLHQLILSMIAELGTSIPRFNIPSTAPDATLRVGRAVLMLSQLMEQCSRYALGRSRFKREILILLLCDRFQA